MMLFNYNVLGEMTAPSNVFCSPGIKLATTPTTQSVKKYECALDQELQHIPRANDVTRSLQASRAAGGRLGIISSERRADVMAAILKV